MRLKSVLITVIGVANILLAASDGYLLGFVLVHNLEPRNRVSFHEIRFLLTFTGIGIINAAFMVVLAYLGWRIFTKDPYAISKCIKLFVAEILYSLVGVIVFWNVLPGFGSGMADPIVARALGVQLALAPQVISGYPIIGVLILLWVKK